MIVAPIILHSARTGKYRTLATVEIANDGTGSQARGNYNVRVRGKNLRVMREGRLENWPRKQKHVTDLVAAALQEVKT